MTALPMVETRERVRGLRRMKGLALSLLVAAALTYLVARKMETTSTSEVWGYVRAAAEAGVVGGLADWFAVTALFRRPLGLPIPHTALIPNRKDQLGTSLSDFVHGNFMSPENIRLKVMDAQPAQRLSEYLMDSDHRRVIVSEGAALGVKLLDSMDDQEISTLVRNAAFTELQLNAWGPPAGRLLGAAISERQHHGVVEALLAALHRWLLENKDGVSGVVADRGPVAQAGPIRWMHERVGERATEMVTTWVAQLRDNPDDPARIQLDDALARIADELQHDERMLERIEGWKSGVLRHSETHRAINSIWPTAKTFLLDALQDEDSDLRARADSYLLQTAVRLRDDQEYAAELDERIGKATAFLVERYGEDAVGVISETVKRWDANEASRKIELAVGRDLQYIRINGTIVGSLAGLAIYTISGLLL